MLGVVEASRTTDTVCRAFSDDLKQMVAALRQDLGQPNLPFIMGEYEAGAGAEFAVTRPWPKIVDEQIKLLPFKLALSATVNSVGIAMKDDRHYSADVGQPEFARRVIAVIQSKGWGPGNTAIFRPGAAPRSGNPLWPQGGRLAVSRREGRGLVLYLLNGAAFTWSR